MPATTRKVRVFPYEVSIIAPYNNNQTFYEKFRIDNIDDNLIDYAGIGKIGLSCEPPDGDWVLGTFMKLRDEAPLKFNTGSKTSEKIQLSVGEFVEEASHFAWNLRDRIMIGEYNHFGMRVFGKNVAAYFSRVLSLGEQDFEITGIPIPELWNRITSSRGITAVEFKFAPLSFDAMNGVGVTRSEILSNAANQPHAQLSLSLNSKADRGHRRDPLDRDNTIELLSAAREYLDKKSFESFRIETFEGAYDLVKGTLVSDRLTINNGDYSQFQKDFYRQARGYYNNNRTHIMQMLDRN